MGLVGDCYDNAMAESFFASLEKELVHQQRRRCFATRAEAELKIFEYIEGFYNRTRLHSALDFWSPVEFEQAHHEMVATQHEQEFQKSPVRMRWWGLCPRHPPVS